MADAPREARLRRRGRLDAELSYMASRVAGLYAILGPVHLADRLLRVSGDAQAVPILARLAAHALELAIVLYERLAVLARRAARRESYAVLGVLDPVASSRSLPLGKPPVWLTVERGLEHRDAMSICSRIMLLSRTALRLAEMLEELATGVMKLLRPELTRLAETLRRRTLRLRSLYASICSPIPREEVAARCSICLSPHIRDAWRLLLGIANDLVQALRSTPLEAWVGRKPRLEAALLTYPQRLYELYTLLLTLEALTRIGGEARLARDRLIVVSDGLHTLIYYNTVPRLEDEIPSRLAGGRVVQDAPQVRALLRRAAGRPDVTIACSDGIRAIIEAKYSRRPSYLTAARFKTIAYIHEYNARLGILVYPGISAGHAHDEEEEETTRLLREAEKLNGLTILLKNDAMLHIQPAPPDPSRERAVVEALEAVLHPALSGCQP